MKNTVKSREIEIHVHWDGSDNPFWVTFWRFYKDPKRPIYYASYHFPTKESLSRIEQVMGHAQIQGKYGHGIMTVLGTFHRRLKKPDEKLKVSITVKGGVVVDERYDNDFITLEVHDLDTGRCDVCEDLEVNDMYARSCDECDWHRPTLVCNNGCGYQYCEKCRRIGDPCGCKTGKLIHEDDLGK